MIYYLIYDVLILYRKKRRMATMQRMLASCTVKCEDWMPSNLLSILSNMFLVNHLGLHLGLHLVKPGSYSGDVDSELT